MEDTYWRKFGIFFAGVILGIAILAVAQMGLPEAEQPALTSAEIQQIIDDAVAGR